MTASISTVPLREGRKDNMIENQEADAAVPSADARTALSGHTPGPLEIVEAKTIDTSGQWHIYLAAPDGRKIAALWGGQKEKMANAKLFAAAPMMLAALQEMVRLYGNHADNFSAAARAQARAAITSAVGDQP